MIYTITCNPSLDYTMYVDTFIEGELHRTNMTDMLPGGKGINVSQVLQQMNIENIALGYVGGYSGQYLIDQLNAQHIRTDFVHVEEPTRINVKIKANVESEINASGPFISDEHVATMLAKLEKVTEGDYLVLSGSVPSNVASFLYGKVAKVAVERGATIVVDAEKSLLEQTLAYQPLFIKPNIFELGQFFEVTLKHPKEAIHYARELIKRGAQSVIVSLGGDGALYVSENDVYYAASPKGCVQNTVGAGDSVVAGFLGAYVQSENVQKAFRYGVAAGSATAFSSTLANKEAIERLVGNIKLEDWSDHK